MSARLGPRDIWALLWVAQMCGVPMDVLGQLLAVWPMGREDQVSASEKNAYRVVQRWRAADRVIEDKLRPVPGPFWVVTEKDTASALLGFRVPEWLPSPMMAAHTTALARLRLHLAAGKTEDTWISERMLRHRNGYLTKPGESMPHLHDAHWTDDLGHLHAIEVELTRKGSAEARATMQAAYDAAADIGATQLIYYCGSDEVLTRVRAASADITPRLGGPEVRANNASQIFKLEPARHELPVRAAGGAAS
ncbi:hypothetical protein AB0L82_43270 [Nocardia sp. NPDC052001]|uniref:hypothetical protein n=1 Tax=Nocardia sp. NPDC052001 TaxID=3154853 RepID=UPI00343FE3F2